MWQLPDRLLHALGEGENSGAPTKKPAGNSGRSGRL